MYQFTVDNVESYFSKDPYNAPASPGSEGLYLDIMYYTQTTAAAADPYPTMSDLTYAACTAMVGAITGTALVGAGDHAKTPWIIGAPSIGGEVQELFRFHALSDGLASNDDAKVSIDNITRKTDNFDNPYFVFDVLVRKITDSDKNGMVLYERFTNCNLISTDRNYIVKKIGDAYEYFNTGTERLDTTGT